MFLRVTFEDGYFFEKEYDYSFEYDFDVRIARHGPIVDLLVDYEG